MSGRNKYIKSVFNEISVQVFSATDLKTIKNQCLNYILSTQIKDTDKNLILTNIDKCQSIPKLQKYVCNSLLQYEGLGLNKLK